MMSRRVGLKRLPVGGQLRGAAAIFLVAMVAGLGGCGGILPQPSAPPRLFILSPKTTFDKDLPRVNWQLTVALPIAEAGLNTTRIALRHSPVSLEYYARAAWTDRAPSMVQTLLVESYENSHRIVAVGRQSVSLRADYSLISELREFQAEYSGDGPPDVRVRINAKLVRMPQREIVGSISSEHVQPAEGTDLDSIVHAFDEALGKTIRRIVEWTLRAAPPQ